MAGIRVIQLQEIEPASALHPPWIKNRHVGDIVALIDATLAQAQCVSSNPAIPPAPITAAAASSRRAASSSADGFEARRLTVQTPISSHRFDHGHELPLFFLRRVPLERWRGRWLIGISLIGDGVMDQQVILAMVSSDASGR